jgi:hypothetical protein
MALVGFIGHVLLVFSLILYPNYRYSIENKILKLVETKKPAVNVLDEINISFGKWLPKSDNRLGDNQILVNGREFVDLTAALNSLQDGDTLELGSSIYKTPLVIRNDRVTVLGKGHVIFDGAVAENKAAIVIKGNSVSIYNIECKGIKVPDQNGACVRLEGANLLLNHVYFHDSEQGLLTGGQPELIKIKDSRFELLGRSGRAHGIYVGGGELYIEDSLFIAAVDQGHEIKSRAKVTEIIRSVVASLSSNDSRLIDISNGGIVSIRDSILEKGPGSVNSDLIGYGLEGYKHKSNYIELKDNIVIMDRERNNNLLHSTKKDLETVFDSNVFIGREEMIVDGVNLWYKSRGEAGIKKYPFIPLPYSK